MQTTYATGLMWFRRDLRAHDNAALHKALASCSQVHCVFVFDRTILDRLPTRRDRRVEFIRESLACLDENLRRLAGPHAGLIVRHGFAAPEIERVARELGVDAVFANHDYEPAALARDAACARALTQAGIALHTFKDQVVFEKAELLTQAGTAYSVFTPYKKAWLARLDRGDLAPHAIDKNASHLAPRPLALRCKLPTLADLGFEQTNLRELQIPMGSTGAHALLEDFALRMDRYRQTRDFPAIKGPSYLSVHLRFGTVSIRELVARAHARASQASEGAATWLGELIWRDFYFQVLANFPHVCDASGESHSFRPAYDAIEWESGSHAQALFAAWCEGRTGYPLVDAAMAQINRTGYMHNRLRMVVASFLTKDLGVDWRWGENTLPSTSSILTCQPTTAAGSGPAPAAAMPSPTFASSIQSARAASSIPMAASSNAICRNWHSCQASPCMRRGWPARWSWRRPAWCWGATIPCRSLRMTRHANAHCAATPS